MDFYRIKERSTKAGVEVYPDFKVCRSKDLMVRGKSFYAIWDEEIGMWSTDEYDVQRLVDHDLSLYVEKLSPHREGVVNVKYLSAYSTRSWAEFKNYMGNLADNSHQLDVNLTFLNTDVKKKDYVSKRLPYPLETGPCDAYEELISTLYDPEERAKLEWAIGAIIAGDAKNIQKFIVLYGSQGSGKSTLLNVIQKLFTGYYTTFEAKALTSTSNAFSTEVFKANPLVAIQHDGDLSRIEDNTKLNSIVSHEEMTLNEKYKPAYMARINSLLFMGTNKPVKITDAKSGIIRRLIDVKPSGRKIKNNRYHTLIGQIDFELGAIAAHCLEVYRGMGKDYYSNYRPVEMMLQTDVFFNFVEAHYHVFNTEDGISITQAYEMYKTYCDESMVEFKLARHKFREELKNYFHYFTDVTRIDGKQVRSFYSGFIKEKFKHQTPEDHSVYPLVLDQEKSLIDDLLQGCPAQHSKLDEFGRDIPIQKWASVTTTLADVNTREIHYVKPPENHIVIDFDLTDESGEKSAELNIAAASTWPPTYAEFSKGGAGVHLHYDYTGDNLEELSRVYSEGIEIKVFNGGSSLRRKLSKCNNVPVAKLNSGLPLREKKVIDFDAVRSEKALRTLIERNLRKEIHPGTKPSVDFIKKILDDATESGMHYDVTDMRQKVLTFALRSTNQARYCMKLVDQMKFASEEPSEAVDNPSNPIAFFDAEVFPNLFVVCWKFAGKERSVVRMINPKPHEIEQLLKLNLIGFNCRRYDNHILYAALMGYSVKELYELSQKIISGNRSAMFGEAYNISYTDIYDYSTVKQSLKKFEIELGLIHLELGLPWDEPVPEELWEKVADYCANDVVATEAVHEDRHADFVARQVLADLSGLSVNDTTQRHTSQILFGSEPKPQSKFIYTDLSVMFPGYKYDYGKSSYRGEDPGEGGYVYAEPGMYTDVALLDVASMHPTSIENLNLFGPYTEKFSEIKKARVAIKHRDYDLAKGYLGGILEKYLGTEEESDQLAYALKIVINIVYGLTSAKFENKFRDVRNKDNIVAKRGALFMIDLKHAVQERGFQVVHIKTDSIKIANATQEIIDFVFEFGKKYDYDFEHEATFDKFCLVNDAVYIAKYKDGKNAGKWTATGAQFAHPYVFKTLFTREPVVFGDLCETKSVTTALYLDMNEGLGSDEHNYQFVGRVGRFVPILPGQGGGLLLREKEGKYYAAVGTKGYRWLEATRVETLKKQDTVDHGYHKALVDDAVANVSKHGDFEWFIS